MKFSVPEILKSRIALLVIAVILVLGGALVGRSMVSNNDTNSQVLATSGTQAPASNQKVKGATTVTPNKTSSSSPSSTSQPSEPATSKPASAGAAPTSSSSSNISSTSPPGNQSQSGNTQSGGNNPPAPAQPTITFSADACYATASNAAGDLFVLAVQDGPTVETSHRGAGIATETIPASGTLTLTTGAPFDQGTTYSIAQIKDPTTGTVIAESVAVIPTNCS